MKITAGVKCYNNAKYIRAAVESAFAQTYRPLEIVISDDASTDGSWEIINEVIASHEGERDVDVVKNRNEFNLGNLGNWEKICELASGDFIVKFDGDDISLPERVERIASAVGEARSLGRDPTVVGHGGWMIGPSGQRMGPMRPPRRGYAVGAAMAFSRRCFTMFGKSKCDAKVVDDEIYARRGMMLGSFLEVSERLVLYRIGTGVSNSLFSVRKPLSLGARNMLTSLGQSAQDVGKVDAGRQEDWSRKLSDERTEFIARQELIDGDSFGIRSAAARRMHANGRVWRFLKFAFVLPRFAGDPLLFLYALVRYYSRRISGVCSDAPSP